MHDLQMSGAEPFPLTDVQFVVDTVTMLTKGLEQS